MTKWFLLLGILAVFLAATQIHGRGPVVDCTLAATLADTTALSNTTAKTVPVDAAQRLPTQHLPNAIRLHPQVISGGLPDGDAGFAELARLGVKTIISVDGMTPDVQLAEQYGLRYVHLPHGYDGVPDDRVGELAKAVRDLPGPIYIHCHHGKHRSPAAASAACVAAGLIPASSAIPILKLAGTYPNYRGLYQSVRNAKRMDNKQLDAVDVEFRSVAAIPAIAEAMIAIEHIHDHLQLIAQSNWRTPSQHPDLDPTHEALLLLEHYTELLRAPELPAKEAEYQRMLRESESAATALHKTLIQWNHPSPEATPPASLHVLLQQISDQCKACHVQYRDNR